MQVRTIVRSMAERPTFQAPTGLKTDRTPTRGFQLETEYVRAVTGAKLQRMFAKPFVRAMNDHQDGVYLIAEHPTLISVFATASVDGSMKLYDVSSGHLLSSLDAHSSWVTGAAIPACAPETLVTCGRDSLLRFWKLPEPYLLAEDTTRTTNHQITLQNSIVLSASPSHLAHSYVERQLALATPLGVDLFDHERQEPLSRLVFSDDGVSDSAFSYVQFNPAEPHLLAAISVTKCVFFDTRVQDPVFRFSLWNRPTCLSFNPYYPNVFAISGNDGNCYSFDIRTFRYDSNYTPMDRFIGATGAVLSCAFSPDGTVLATGGYDQAIRLYKVRTVGPRTTLKERQGEVFFTNLDTVGMAMDAVREMAEKAQEDPELTNVAMRRARPNAFYIQPYDTYHNRRMQRIWAVRFTGDGRFVLSGSEDANLRVWKTYASESLRTLRREEADAIEYRNTLVNKFQNTPEVQRVLKSHLLPKPIRSKQRTQAIHLQAVRRKRDIRAAEKGYKTIPEPARVVRDVEK